MALGDTAQMSPATVSIAIPVFNGERYLRESLASALAQTRPADEVLVMDNASTDQTREIAESMLPGAVRTAETNLGAVANFNRAVEEASGEYFAWLAADDLLAPAFLERALPALEAVPTAPACLTAIRFVDVDGRPQGEQRDPELSSADAGVRLRSLLRRPRWTEVYCLYRRSALLASPRFRDAWGADVILTWWFLLRGPLLVLDEPLLDYRVYPVKTVDMTAASLNPGAARQALGHARAVAGPVARDPGVRRRPRDGASRPARAAARGGAPALDQAPRLRRVRRGTGPAARGASPPAAAWGLRVTRAITT